MQQLSLATLPINRRPGWASVATVLWLLDHQKKRPFSDASGAGFLLKSSPGAGSRRPNRSSASATALNEAARPRGPRNRPSCRARRTSRRDLPVLGLEVVSAASRVASVSVDCLTTFFSRREVISRPSLINFRRRTPRRRRHTVRPRRPLHSTSKGSVDEYYL